MFWLPLAKSFCCGVYHSVVSVLKLLNSRWTLNHQSVFQKQDRKLRKPPRDKWRQKRILYKFVKTCAWQTDRSIKPFRKATPQLKTTTSSMLIPYTLHQKYYGLGNPTSFYFHLWTHSVVVQRTNDHFTAASGRIETVMGADYDIRMIFKQLASHSKMHISLQIDKRHITSIRFWRVLKSSTYL